MLIPQIAERARCPLCGQMILGRWGKAHVPSAIEIGNALRVDEDPDVLWPQVHPDDTLDQIVPYEGAWVHDYCARDEGARVA